MNLLEMGNRLRLVRKNRTQKEFASQYGILQGTLSKMERGKLEPGIVFLTQVSKKEDVSLNWILTGETDEITKRWVLREPLAEYQALPISVRRLLNSVVEILESGDAILIEALKANIRAYSEAVRVAKKDERNKSPLR